MKTLCSFIIALFLLTSLAALSANESITHCDQQLIQANISCADSEALENCIVSTLGDTDCKLEIAYEEEVNFCNESCAPDIRIDLVSNTTNF